MKKLYTLLILMVVGTCVFAQQDPHYSQYMFNGQVLNPAYCGSLDWAAATFIVREQWVGLEGRPRTQSFGFNTPTENRKNGFGIYAVNDNIGATGSTRIGGQYSYRIHFTERMNLAFGLQASVLNFRSTVSDLRSQTAGDPTLSANDVNVWKPNFGTGIYFNSPYVFAGFSIPELLSNTLDEDGVVNTQEDRVYLATAGVLIPLGENLKFKPSVLAKFHNAVPPGLDINGMFVIKDRFWLGASYRLDDAVIFLADFQVLSYLRVGYAYDRTLSELNSYSSGSHELMLGIDLNFKRDDVSPRYFR